MIDMRLRIPELMAKHDPPLRTAYQLARATNDRISMTTAYRLVDTAGRPVRIELETMDILCETFDVGPGELLERDTKRRKAG